MLRLSMLTAVLCCGALSLDAGEAPQVTTAVPLRQDIHRWVQIPASTRANQEVVLHARIAGHLTAITVDRGSQVTLGQHLATVEAPEMNADLTRLRAELEVATSSNKRLLAAREKAPDLIVAREVDEADGRVRIAAAALQRCESLVSFGKVVAPFAGVVTDRWADPGAYIPVPTSGGGGGALVTIADVATVRVIVPVPEKEAAFIKAGQPVTVHFDALPPLNATISRHSHAIDRSTGTMSTEVDLPNPQMKIMPGMFARVRVAMETHAQVLTVPNTALMNEGPTSVVFVVVSNQTRKTVIKLGLNDGVRSEILSGIAESDQIAQVAAGLSDGKTVTVVAKP